MNSTITSKGQITLPGKIRKKLNLTPGDKVDFIFDEEGQVILIPQKKSVKELKGMVPKAFKVITLDEMQKTIEQGRG